MALAVLCAVLGGWCLYQHLETAQTVSKYLWLAVLWVFVGACCYQGVLGLFLTLGALIAICRERTLRRLGRALVIVGVVYAVGCALNLGLTKLVATSGRLTGEVDLWLAMQVVWERLPGLLKFFTIIPAWVFPACVSALIVTLVICTLKKREFAGLGQFGLAGILITLIALLGAVAPAFVQSTASIDLAPRTTYGFAGTFGLLLVLAWFYCGKRMPKILLGAVVALGGFWLGVVLYNFYDITVSLHSTNFADLERVVAISDALEDYQFENNLEIEQLTLVKSTDTVAVYPGVRNPSGFNTSALAILWSLAEAYRALIVPSYAVIATEGEQTYTEMSMAIAETLDCERTNGGDTMCFAGAQVYVILR